MLGWAAGTVYASSRQRTAAARAAACMSTCRWRSNQTSIGLAAIKVARQLWGKWHMVRKQNRRDSEVWHFKAADRAFAVSTHMLGHSRRTLNAAQSRRLASSQVFTAKCNATQSWAIYQSLGIDANECSDNE